MENQSRASLLGPSSESQSDLQSIAGGTNRDDFFDVRRAGYRPSQIYDASNFKKVASREVDYFNKGNR